MLDEERESIKNKDYLINELNRKVEKEKISFNEIVNQKKEINEKLINLEKQVNTMIKIKLTILPNYKINLLEF